VALFEVESAEARLYEIPGATQHGANAVTVREGRIYASHSDLGLLSWPLNGGQAASVFPEYFAPACRSAQTVEDGGLLVCAREGLYRFAPRTSGLPPRLYPAPPDQSLVAAAQQGEHLYAATVDGLLLRWERDSPGAPPAILIRRAVKTYDLTLVHTGKRHRLVLSSREAHVRIVRPGPPATTTHYHAPKGVILRFARAADDVVVAVDAACARLYLWEPPNTESPRHCLVMPENNRSRIQDLCLMCV
jgi:hypothetical protein